jgi:phosphoribosylglycinamide formyltransferase-1
MNIPVFVVKGISDPETEELQAVLARHQVDFIALAGFMRKIPGSLVRAFENRMLNIHPALLPAFGGTGMYGSRVHEAVIAEGVSSSGATVHIVDEEYDTGPIVLQESITVLGTDTPASLAMRVLEVEHRLYPKAIDLFARKLIQIRGREVIIQPKS